MRLRRWAERDVDCVEATVTGPQIARGTTTLANFNPGWVSRRIRADRRIIAGSPRGIAERLSAGPRQVMPLDGPPTDSDQAGSGF